MKGSLLVNRKRFCLAGTVSLITTLAVLISLVFTGTVFAAMPLAGVGGIVVKASNIVGKNVEILPSLHSTNVDDNAQHANPIFPQSQITMSDVWIDGLHMLKDIDLSHLQIPQNPINFVQVDISASGTATGSGMTMNATQINAAEADLTDMTAEENMLVNHPVDIAVSPILPKGFSTPTQKWSGSPQRLADVGITAGGITMTDGVINSHYLAMQSIKLPGFQLALNLYGSTTNADGSFTVYPIYPYAPTAQGGNGTAPFNNKNIPTYVPYTPTN